MSQQAPVSQAEILQSPDLLFIGRLRARTRAGGYRGFSPVRREERKGRMREERGEKRERERWREREKQKTEGRKYTTVLGELPCIGPPNKMLWGRHHLIDHS